AASPAPPRAPRRRTTTRSCTNPIVKLAFHESYDGSPRRVGPRGNRTPGGQHCCESSRRSKNVTRRWRRERGRWRMEDGMDRRDACRLAGVAGESEKNLMRGFDPFRGGNV